MQALVVEKVQALDQALEKAKELERAQAKALVLVMA